MSAHKAVMVSGK